MKINIQGPQYEKKSQYLGKQEANWNPMRNLDDKIQFTLVL